MLPAELSTPAQQIEFNFMTPADIVKESDYPEVASYFKEQKEDW
jgi:hypothetical protein